MAGWRSYSLGITPREREMSARNDIIAELEAAYTAMRAKIADLDDAAWDETWLGTWKLNEMLAHMAGWAREMEGGIKRVGRGERPTPEGVNYGDTEGWNTKFAAVAKPGKSALADWDDAMKGYLDAARALPEDLFGTSDDGKVRIGSRLLTGAGIHHFEEHNPELDAWLASRKG